METSLTQSSGSLDAVTYFFVNSGVFILAIAIPFFVIGLWLGRLTWGRYKRLFRQSEAVVENLKGEVSQLKRRIAEQATRPISTFAHQAAPLTHASSPPMRATVFPEGNMICVWTEPDWQPPKVTPQPVSASEAFSLWMLPDFRPGLGFAPSRAFSLWTSDDWEPAFTPKATLPVAKPFSIWTESGWEPAKRVHPWSKAFSLWTDPDWSPSPPRPQPPSSSAAFSIWTEAGWEPIKREHPWSMAFSLWTRPEWEPSSVSAAPTPPSRAFAVWTEPDWEPIKRVHPWSQAFTKWTAADWQSPVVPSSPAQVNAAFSVWTEEGWEGPKRVHPWSHAFCLWTADDWVPVVQKTSYLPPSQAFCLWTAPDWEPVVPKPKPSPEPAKVETASIPGAAPSVATIFAKAKSATSRIPVIPSDTNAKGHSTQRLTPSREMIAAVAASVKPLTPATLISSAESSVPVIMPVAAPLVEELPPQAHPSPERPQPPRAQFARPVPLAPAPRPAQGFFARIVSATKAALGMQKPEPPLQAAPSRSTTRIGLAPSAEVMAVSEPVLAPEVTDIETSRSSVRKTPLLSGETSRIKLPKSQAFTVWTQPAWVPPTTKSSPIPRPEGLEPAPQAKEPKRQILPRSATSSVPTVKSSQIPLPLVTAPAHATMAVPVPRPDLVAVAEASVPAETEVPITPPVAPEIPTTRYDELVAKLKSVSTPPAGPPVTPELMAKRANSGLPSGTVAFMGEILSGAVRNDFLLGVVYRSAPATIDDLTELKGIASVLQTKLHDMGVFTFKQIALWNDEQAHEFSNRLGFKDRAEREHWREQARALYEQKYGVKLGA